MKTLKVLKVLLVNGSPNETGSTYVALSEVASALQKENIQTEIFQVSNEPIRDCTGCLACRKLNNRCAFKSDIVNKFIEKAEFFDGFVFGTPVHYAHPSGKILTLLDRAFYSAKEVFAYKPGTAVVVARRGGTTASFDVMNKYFTINNMPVVSSQYWNNAHGLVAQDVPQDLEGLQIMRTLGKNMAWLLKCIELGKEHGVNRPEKTEEIIRTNFI